MSHAIGATLRTRSATAWPQTERAVWLRATILGAFLLTSFDAVLLQKSKAFFTGGFLAPLHVSGVSETLLFLFLSLLVDAAVIGSASAVTFALIARFRLTSRARIAALLLAGIGPLFAVDVATYRLHTYLGDSFDLGLMFELVGRRPDEIFAVASPQIIAASMLLLAMTAVCLVGLWGLNRPRTLRHRVAPSIGWASRVAAIFLMGGVLTSAIAAGASETFADGLRRKPSGRLLETAAATVTDVDGDGFGLAGGMRDPALFDGSIFPWAVDLPGNGIDEDGIGGDLPAGALPYVEGNHARAPWTSHPDVVLFVLESFRADAVGRRVNGRPVTPILDSLANEGISVSAAYSHNGYTAQSRFHLMTGSLAGLRGGTSLIDDFAANGYETAYFSAQDESFGGEGLGVGFERASASYDARRDRGQRYSTFSTPGSLAVSYKTLEARVAAFLEQRDRGRPLFLYVNFHDTHYPYHHDQILPLVSSTVLPVSQIGPARASALQEMYFNTAANVDSAVGRVVEKTAAWLGRSPAVIVTADHGESLFDEGFVGHGYKLNEVQTRVPLIVRGLPLHIEEPFGQIDLRDALNTALTHDPSDLKPRLDRRQDKAVFQYLGNIDRPRQIGLLTGSAQLVYDFRQQRVRTTRTEGWRRIEDLTSEEHARFQQVLWSWERMILARNRR